MKKQDLELENQALKREKEELAEQLEAKDKATERLFSALSGALKFHSELDPEAIVLDVEGQDKQHAVITFLKELCTLNKNDKITGFNQSAIDYYAWYALKPEKTKR